MAPIKFGIVKIDSFKVIIPMNKVDVRNGKLNQPYVNIKLYESTGELLETLNRDTNTYSDKKGIKIKLEVCRIKFDNVGQKGFTGEEFLIFQPSSKLLEKIYFDGINLDNLPLIYNYLINLNIVHFSYESFLNARFCDVDFCIDYPITVEEFRQSNTNIELSVLEKLKLLVKPFDKHTGLQFNERERATPTRPFIKFYHKSTELTQKSNEFYCEFLKDNYFNEINSGIGRYEVTVKNAEFKKHYKIESMSVEELLNIPSATIENMFKRFLPNYLYKSIREKKMKLSPTNEMLLVAINKLIHYGESEQEIIHSMLNPIDEKVARSRSKKLLQELFEQVNNPTQLAENNESKKVMNDFYKAIGFYRDEGN
jgi:hypothetical protein